MIGGWKLGEKVLEEDFASQRIKWLITNHLLKVGTDSSGWVTLYRDPADGRFWELTYPESDSHGGGSPCLTHLPDEEIRLKYNLS